MKMEGFSSTGPLGPIFSKEHTKVTKVSDIDNSKLLNFVFFVTFVVKFTFSSLVAAPPLWG